MSIADLEHAAGDDVARLFLEIATAHDNAVIRAAEAELGSGQNIAAITKAHAVIVDRAAEIELMTRLRTGADILDAHLAAARDPESPARLSLVRGG